MNEPIATVGAILTCGDRADPRVLLTRRACEPHKGRWCLPGGSISQFESARDAVIREVREETQLTFEPTFFQCFDEIIPGEQHHHILLAFEGTPIGVPTHESSEVEEVKWFSVSEALQLELAFTNRDVLQAYASKLRADAIYGGFFAEYAGLRGEITRRIAIRWQIEAFTMVFSTGFLAWGISENVNNLVLLLVPCFVALLAAAWAHNNLRIGELGHFIEQQIEPRCPGLRWERWLRQTLGKEAKWYIRIRVRLYAYAVFLISALFMPLAAFARGTLAPSLFSHVVLAVNLILGLVVFLLIKFGRRVHERPQAE